MIPGMVATSSPSVNSYLLVPDTEATSYRVGMRPKDIRHQNLKLLVEEFGTIAEVARNAGTSEKYLSQVLAKRVQRNSARGIGDVVAAKLETGCKKAPGWIDIDHTQADDDARPNQVGEGTATPYNSVMKLTDDEQTILNAFRILDVGLRASWLRDAEATLMEHSAAAKKPAA